MRWLAILFVFLAATALAQCPEFLGNEPAPLDWDNILGPETLFGDPVCLLKETQVFLGNATGIGLFEIVDRLANILFLVFTGIALVNLAARNSLELSLWFLAKLFIVGMVFQETPGTARMNSVTTCGTGQGECRSSLKAQLTRQKYYFQPPLDL
jgi:hypothetical protein